MLLLGHHHRLLHCVVWSLHCLQPKDCIFDFCLTSTAISIDPNQSPAFREKVPESPSPPHKPLQQLHTPGCQDAKFCPVPPLLPHPWTLILSLKGLLPFAHGLTTFITCSVYAPFTPLLLLNNAAVIICTAITLWICHLLYIFYRSIYLILFYSIFISFFYYISQTLWCERYSILTTLYVL